MVQQKNALRLLTLFYSRPGLAKSRVFLSLVKHLQSLKVPAWYVALSRPLKSLEEFVSEHRFVSTLVLDQTLEKLNQNGHSPLLVIDGAHHLADNGHCHLCGYIRALFENKKVSIVLLSDRPSKNGVFRMDDDLYQRLLITQFQDSSMEEKVSLLAKEKTPLDPKQVEECREHYEPVYEQLVAMKENLKEECEKQASEERESIDEESLATMRLVHNTPQATYGNLRAQSEGDLLQRLNTAMEKEYLLLEDGVYRVTDPRLAVLLK